MEMYEELEKTLFEFVKRVSKGETTSDLEVQVLPEVVRELKDLLING